VANLQVKHVDPEVHDELRRRAAEAGTTLGEYVLEIIRRDLRRPSRAEWLASVRTLPAIPERDGTTLAQIDAERAGRPG
jgi:plasmid stability protein